MNALHILTSLSAGLMLAAPGYAAPARAETQNTMLVYVGTYSGSGAKGIYRLHLDLGTGALTGLELAAETAEPSFLALDPEGRFLFAVNERAQTDDSVSAFAIDRATGALTFLNAQPAGGSAPCHMVVDKKGKHVLVANYFGGNAAVLPVAADGKLGERTDLAQHEGKGPDVNRQEAPHAHSINLDAANRYAFVADLGIDKLVSYRFDAERGKLLAHEAGTATLAPGSGPRHLAFGPGQKQVYVLAELTSAVAVFDYDAEKGALKEVQSLPTLPKGFTGANTTAEVVVRPDGRFLYASNRGHDSIAIFAVDARTGRLTAAGHQPTLGKTPRNFVIDPTGAFLLAANQGSDTIAVFRIDAESGQLKAVGDPVAVPRPVCVRLLRPVPAAPAKKP
jgi:6-phosphogluconolactonase